MSDIIELQDKLLDVYQHVTLSRDGIKVNNLQFLTTISLNIYYKTAQYLPSTTADIHIEKIEEVARVYKAGGFSITEIHCDKKFRAALDPWKNKQK